MSKLSTLKAQLKWREDSSLMDWLNAAGGDLIYKGADSKPDGWYCCDIGPFETIREAISAARQNCIDGN